MNAQSKLPSSATPTRSEKAAGWVLRDSLEQLVTFSIWNSWISNKSVDVITISVKKKIRNMSLAQVNNLLMHGWPTLMAWKNEKLENQYCFLILPDRVEELIAKYTGVNPEYEGKDISQNP